MQGFGYKPHPFIGGTSLCNRCGYTSAHPVHVPTTTFRHLIDGIVIAFEQIEAIDKSLDALANGVVEHENRLASNGVAIENHEGRLKWIENQLTLSVGNLTDSNDNTVGATTLVDESVTVVGYAQSVDNKSHPIDRTAISKFLRTLSIDGLYNYESLVYEELRRRASASEIAREISESRMDDINSHP